MLLIGPRKCPECGANHDSALPRCPECGKETDIERAKHFGGFYPLGTLREIIVLLVGALGLRVVSTIVQAIVISGAPAAIRDDGAALYQWVSEPQRLAVIDYVAYALVFVAICLVVFDKWKGILRSFKWQYLLFGVLGAVVLYLVQIAYGAILNLSGLTVTDNNNQSLVASLVLWSPVLAIIFLVILGPLVEEFTYRVGLFGFLKRINAPLAYLACALVFGFIHFDFNDIASANEWLNLPSYILSGLLLCFVYHKGGLFASGITHILYNGLSIVLIIATA